ncbi:MAG: hypothetical protein RIR18_1282 [Pseudomonadota bacterium]|jgi:uncharacterized protein (DUF927 family)
MKENHFFKDVGTAALSNFDTIMARLGLSGGKNQGREYLPLNPKRSDSKPGSFSINKDTGAWSDFATGDSGGDLIGLAAYILSTSQFDAAKELANALGVPIPDHSGKPTGNRKPEASRPTPSKPPKDDTPQPVCVMPVPDDAPSPPAAHVRHGKPIKRWPYCTIDGRVNFYHDRYEPKGERKQFSPLTLWKQPDGKLLWQFKAAPAPRPLLGLPSLYALSDKAGPVIVVEGEKAADAASVLFPTQPVISWQGGAQAVLKADWGPLAEHSVWLWPDNDDPGTKAMRDVYKALAGVGVSDISLIRLDALGFKAETSENGAAMLGVPEPLQQGDDAADLVARGWTTEHIKQAIDKGLIQAIAPTQKATTSKAGADVSSGTESPRMPIADRFRVDETGVWQLPQRENENAKWVCGRLEVVAMVRDTKNTGWGQLVEFFDPDRTVHRVIVPMSLFRGDGAEVAGLLLANGLRIAAKGKQALLEYLQTRVCHDRARTTNKTGWHLGADGDSVFVLGDVVYGTNAETWLFDNETAGPSLYACKGKLSQWRDEVAALCVGNTRVMFAVSTAFAAPLLHLLGAEGGGFHLCGDSSDGKTTALLAAASVCGNPSSYKQQWRNTDNAIESMCTASCDTLLVMDELAQVDSKIAGETAYMIANGSAKGRSQKQGGMRERATWRVLFISSGEVGLSAHMAEAGKTIKAGQEIRMAEIPTDAGKGLGVFEELHGLASGAELSKAIEKAAKAYYGTPFHAFLTQLVANQSDIPEVIKACVKSFEQHTLKDDAHGQSRRVAARFGLVAAAGELATEWGITGWDKGEAIHAAITCFRAWVAKRGGQGNSEDRIVIDHIREILLRKNDSAFTDWDRPANKTGDHSPGKPDRYGYRQSEAGDTGHHFYIWPEVFRSVFCKGRDPASVGDLLVSRGYCQAGKEAGRAKWITKTSLPTEGQKRVVHILPSMFNDEGG